MFKALVIIGASSLKRCYVTDVAVKKKLPVVAGVKEAGVACSKQGL